MAQPRHDGLMRSSTPGCSVYDATEFLLSELSPQWQNMVTGGTGKGSSMKWQAVLAGALASALVTTVASAEVRIINDPGGEISSYVSKFHDLREVRRTSCHRRALPFGVHIVHRRLFRTNQVCVTPRAVLGFHAASYYDDARRSLVPTRAGTRLVMRLYPPAIRNWIDRHGGLDAADHRDARPRTCRAL